MLHAPEPPPAPEEGSSAQPPAFEDPASKYPKNLTITLQELARAKAALAALDAPGALEGSADAVRALRRAAARRVRVLEGRARPRVVERGAYVRWATLKATTGPARAQPPLLTPPEGIVALFPIRRFVLDPAQIVIPGQKEYAEAYARRLASTRNTFGKAAARKYLLEQGLGQKRPFTRKAGPRPRTYPKNRKTAQKP